MLFTVTDKKGRFITDLARRFSSIREQETAKNPEFTAETDLPLRLAILIDTSNSIRDRFQFPARGRHEFHQQRDAANRTRPWSSASIPRPSWWQI